MRLLPNLRLLCLSLVHHCDEAVIVVVEAEDASEEEEEEAAPANYFGPLIYLRFAPLYGLYGSQVRFRSKTDGSAWSAFSKPVYKSTAALVGSTGESAPNSIGANSLCQLW